MEFKIDTKEAFTLITPLTNVIDANLTDALQDKCEELGQSGSNNYIVILDNCTDIDNTSPAALVAMHEVMYSNDSSLVFTGLQKDVLNKLKEDETDLLLNITPSMQEAIDIISMEILERDLFGEEE